jgi:hypothetical protein
VRKTDVVINMGAVKDIADTVIGVVNVVGDSAHYAKAMNYFMDAEKYKMLGDDKMFRALKRRCLAEYRSVITPGIRDDLADKIKIYLKRKP